MRKALFGMLMATALAAPALAQDAEMPENYRRQAERNQAAVDRQEARAAARAERQAQRQSAAPSVERREERVEQRQERREQRAIQQNNELEAQQQVQRERPRREERQERREDRQERRASREDIQTRIERERAQRVYPSDMPENYRRQWDRNEAAVAREEETQVRRREALREARRDNRRDNRRDWNNGRQWGDDDRNWSNNRNRWDRAWRQDRRYDWQRYRYSNRSIFRPGPYYSPYRNYGYNRFSIGITLGRDFYSNRYWINDPWQYRLPQPYAGTRWVRYYNDVLLVDVFNGQVVDVIYDFFW